MEQAIDRELPIKSAYIGPFPLENVNKPRAERCMNYTLGSHNLGFALDSDFICGKPMEVEKITNGKKDFWKKYDMVIILNFPTMFHFNRDNWYYDFDLPEQIRESNPAVKIGIHTEGWPTHFMSVYDPLLVGNVIRWLENADFIISTERKVDTSAYKAFNKRVYYLPYPVPQKICCSDGQTRRITDCRIADHQRENIVAVGGRWYIGETNGYASLRLAASLGLDVKIIDDLPLEKFPLMKINKNILETASGLPMSRIIRDIAPLPWEEYHKRLVPCRLMINLNNQYTFGRAGIDCAITRVPMVGYDCVETARELFPETTAPVHDYVKAKEIAKKLLNEPGFWKEVVSYADSKLSNYSYENCRAAFSEGILPEIGLGRNIIP